ncbi:MAG: PTS sugar transporter subunit IIC [Candidatus Eisenbacteria bacterium]|nr:PTS sugar transporter subunit IIC [Candidatus Eisenbacteria bacterium]
MSPAGPLGNPALLGAEFFALGALLGADQVAGPQWMLSQPLVAGALAGALTGEPRIGLLVGLVAQLAWNGAVPVGSRPNPDVSGGTLAGVLAASAVAPGEGWLRAAVAGAAVALVVGWLGAWPAAWNRRWNSRWTGWALAAPSDRECARRVDSAQRLGWLCTAGLSGTWVLAAGAAGTWGAGALLAWIPARGGAGGALPALAWGLGLAAAALAFGGGARRDWIWAAGGAALAAGLKLAGAL